MKRMLHMIMGLAALAATTADARELRVAPGAPPAHPSNSHLYGSSSNICRRSPVETSPPRCSVPKWWASAR